jgi:nucleotide sugar dehydrogenase
MNISVFGLGKLGSVLAVLLSSNGHKVYGVDRDRQLINDFSKGISPHNEPNLQDLLNSSRKNFTATLDSRTSVLNSDLSILIVPTPSDESGAFSNEYLLTAIKEIGGILKEKETNHLIVISSTVMPLTCDQVIISTLEQSSGKKIGQGLGLIYSPVFIALGSVIHDMQYPDIILIGESDKISGDIYEKIARSLVLNNPVTPISEFGKLLHHSWLYKRELSNKVSTPEIDVIYEEAMKAGATGGKILGAGGGGFLLLFVRPELQEKVRFALNHLIHVPFKFEDSGSRVVLYQPNGL